MDDVQVFHPALSALLCKSGLHDMQCECQSLPKSPINSMLARDSGPPAPNCALSPPSPFAHALSPVMVAIIEDTALISPQTGPYCTNVSICPLRHTYLSQSAHACSLHTLFPSLLHLLPSPCAQLLLSSSPSKSGETHRFVLCLYNTR